MTANAVLSPIPRTQPRREPPPAVTAMVRLIRQSWAVAEPQADEIARYFYSMLFAIAPSTREMFPINMDVQRSRLMRAIVHFVQMVDRPDDLIPFLRQLGRDHRKFGVMAGHFEALGTALLAALKKYLGETWTPQVEMAWAEAYTIMARSMQEAAAADDGPAYWPAHVVHHERLSWDLAIIRVQPEYPVPYQGGQYVSVETPQRPRLWRYFTPANAPREDGVIEFHIRGVEGGWVSRAAVSQTRLGDVWKLGSPMGRLGIDRDNDRDVLLVAGGTGVAPMRAMVEELAQWGDNPRVHLFFGGRTRDDLYDLDTLQNLAVTNPWLTVVPVVESDPGARGMEHGTLADVVTRYGAWADYDTFVSGSPAMIRATVSRMLVAGSALDQIQYDPFTID
jgi:NAD(P)H-flavin reductase/hemoglobin-like flavoprotein